MADIDTLKARLADAEAALHELEMGVRAVKVSFGPGKSVEYTAASVSSLRAYVNRLRDEIARASGARRRGPIYPVF